MQNNETKNINNSQYIWFNDDDSTRNPYCAFRRTFSIENVGDITEALFNIFADTTYKIYVNKKFIGFGPIRFDPKYPQYDTYDLLPYLTEGVNVIAVLVNFHGHTVFKSIPTKAAMITWGNVGDKIDLSTKSGEWKCRRCTEYDRYTPKLSFALNAQVHYNQGEFDEDWINQYYDDSNWKNPVALKNQNCFGKLTPRSIPFMSMEKIQLNSNVRVLPLIDSVKLYSFSVVPDRNSGDDKYNLYWSTYIYSPKKQEINSAVMYEEVWLNYKHLEKCEDIEKPLRYNIVMQLNEGWNYIFGIAGIDKDIYDCYLEIPNDCGLILSADKNSEDLWFSRTNPIKVIDNNLPSEPWQENSDISNLGGWLYTTANNKAESPCREGSWNIFDLSKETTLNSNLEGTVFKHKDYPNGFTLIFDMEHMRLVFPCLKLNGVKGAVIDLLYSDRYMPDNAHVRQQSWIPLGERLVCTNDTLNWSTPQPRGFRYLSLTIRNVSSDIYFDEINFISAHYPVNKAGSFSCSDELLTKIWNFGALTQEINMEDAYDDCVDRERGLYALDMLIQYHVNLACFGDQLLMRRSLELYAQSVTEEGLFRCLYPDVGDYIIPDFSLYIVDAFYRYYLHTGDKSLIQEYWSAIMKNGSF